MAKTEHKPVRDGFLVLVMMVLGISLFSAAGQRDRSPVAQNGISERKDMKTVTIPIEGMSCASCVARVKKTLHAIKGVTEVEVSLAQRAAHVSYRDTEVSPERLTAAINDLGYKAGMPTTERPQ
jgi:copper chaperone CopZ